MCGICGFWARDQRAALSPGVLDAMTDAIRHRGPDGRGTLIRDGVGLGHRRLSIIDLAAGAQPMVTPGGELAVSYNGEIYNFLALRDELIAQGYEFRTRCDTEVLLHGFQAWGERLFERLEGMFAFALHDRANGRVFLVRDRFGIKPLYYTETADLVVFGSEIRCLLKSGVLKAEPDPDRVAAFLELGYVPGNESMFRGVHRVPPAHVVELGSGKETRVARYWSLTSTEERPCSYEEAKDGFRRVFRGAVESHLMSDVPLGAFLSGGVDSTAVVACVRKELGLPLATFSVGYRDDPASSELGPARRIADHFGTEHHEFILDHEGFFEGIDALLDHGEEPIVESAAVALLGLSRFAAQHATVFLSGEGADEAFAGYDLYCRSLKLSAMHRWLLPLRLRSVRAALAGLSGKEKIAKYLDWVGVPLEQRWRTIPNDVSPLIRDRMFDPKFLREHGHLIETTFAALFADVEQRDPVARMQYVDIRTWLVDDLLIKADRMTMAASIELRVPFLDRSVVEFGYSLPARHKIRNGVGKALVKDVVAQDAPRDLMYRPKQGFPTPIAKWLREDLHDRARAILLDERTLARGYVRPDYVRRCLDRHRDGVEDLSHRLFTLLVLELWHRKYVD